MTVNGHFTLNSVFCAVTSRIFVWIFLKTALKITKVDPSTDSSKKFSVDSSFRRYKIYADIRGLII